jgi:hypothetical protein
MPQPIVLIIFSCNTGDTEKLALSAAVGAIQARALIRLRRLQDPDSSETTETLSRMRKEYVPPTDKDILGADVVILVSNATADCSTNPWQSLVALLRKLHAEKMLEGKVRAAFGGIGPSMAELGFTSEENAMMDAVAFGRSLADKTRASKPQ